MFAVTPDARFMVYGGAWDYSIRVYSVGKMFTVTPDARFMVYGIQCRYDVHCENQRSDWLTCQLNTNQVDGEEGGKN